MVAQRHPDSSGDKVLAEIADRLDLQGRQRWRAT
jgi:hypothetical protein